MAGKRFDDSVFQGPRGDGPVRGSSLRPALKRATMAKRDSGGEISRPMLSERLGIIRPKDLRSTCATLAISRGASVTAVSRLLGHADAAITLKRYSAYFDSDLAKLAAEMDSLWAGSTVMAGTTNAAPAA